MGHTTVAVLTFGQLAGVVATVAGVVALYFREGVVDAVRARRQK
ncbi:hypothetical protein [Salinigranum rubrum]|nr:hypothetical protein [Salinigranum rubrum]